MSTSLNWDVFCRVVDNFGDIGVCWRLAADLASRGQRVRLWADDATALDWMAPAGAAGVTVRAWDEAAQAAEPGDVVIEAFGCELPPAFVRAMAARERRPHWFNLEYLSAEDYVERSHGLVSPQLAGPGAGLRKRFFYPGFTPRTGGLIRERGLIERQHAFDAAAWLAARGATTAPGERIVSLFCYEAPPLSALLAQLADRPTLLLATAGHASRQVRAALGPALARDRLRAVLLPALTQHDYDHLLWSCDLNFVRGEDSFVRAQWAAKPFVWQIYPQHDGAHRAKLDAFLARFEAGSALRSLWHAWNGETPALTPLPAAQAWAAACLAWRDRLLAQTDLAQQLLDAVGETG